MFRAVASRFLTETGGVLRRVRSGAAVRTLPATVRSVSDVTEEQQPPFDESLLDVLVCPLSRRPLRYDANTNELINEELGIAYPIVDGIPNMIPQEARLIQKAPPTQS